MTVQEIIDVAARHETRIADATLRACVVSAYERGIPIGVPHGRMARAISERACPQEETVAVREGGFFIMDER